MIWLQVIVVLSAIIIGTRLKGISLGIMGGLGLAILTFFFHLQPTEPPFCVLLIITSVITAAGTLEAAGGLGYLSSLAEKAIKRYPHRITFIAPLITYIFTFLVGTGHIIYSILPIIATVAKETGVRPERPLTTSVIAAQQAAMASPISAPTAILIGLLAPHGIELLDMLCILIPATLGGMLITTLVINKTGKELSEEPGYAEFLKTSQETNHNNVSTALSKVTTSAKLSVILFGVGILFIILLGAFKGLRPSWEKSGKLIPMDMSIVIAIMMLSIAALIVLICKLKPTEITKATVFTGGIQAVISILGISWLGDTFVNANQAQIMELVQAQILKHPWQFSIILFCMSILLVSQTATIRALIPLGLTLGIPALTLLAAVPAVNGLFFIPNYPTLLAAVNLDSTGTTRIGKYILNHSFMLPGLIATSSAVLIAFGLVKYLF
ncbi:MAG: anaerobic C4-dicarboxylate transporter family protein [Candidatus Amoebophilus sp.]